MVNFEMEFEHLILSKWNILNLYIYIIPLLLINLIYIKLRKNNELGYESIYFLIPVIQTI